MFQPTFTTQEIARLEDALFRFCPTRQWQVLTVTFPSTPNTDLDIAHTLTPSDSNQVGYAVIQTPTPLLVYHQHLTPSDSWPSGLVRLRCTQASAQVVLLLYVLDQEGSFTTPTSPASPAFTLPNLTITGDFTHNGLTYLTQTSSAAVTSTTTEWATGGSEATEQTIRVTTVSGLGPKLVGMAPPVAGGVIGSLYRVFNTTASSFDIADQSGAATLTTYQFLTPSNRTITIPPGGSAIFFYDPTTTKWRVIANDYQEGTWTPIDGSGAGLVLANVTGLFTRNGNRVWVDVTCQYPPTASGAVAVIGGLPYTVGALDGAIASRFQAVGFTYTINATTATTGISMYTNAGVGVTNAQLATTFVAGGGSYHL